MEGCEVFSSKVIFLTFFNLILIMLIWPWKSWRRKRWYPLTSWEISIPLDTSGKCFAKLCAMAMNVCAPCLRSHACQMPLSCLYYPEDIFLPLLGGTNWTIHPQGDSINRTEVLSLSEVALSSLCQELGNSREGKSQNEVEFIIMLSGRTLKWKFW